MNRVLYKLCKYCIAVADNFTRMNIIKVQNRMCISHMTIMTSFTLGYHNIHYSYNCMYVHEYFNMISLLCRSLVGYDVWHMLCFATSYTATVS